MWVSLNKRLVNTLHPKFFPVNMIFLEKRPLVYNKICIRFNPRGGARGPLSAPRLIAIRYDTIEEINVDSKAEYTA